MKWKIVFLLKIRKNLNSVWYVEIEIGFIVVDLSYELDLY